jgi:hypothetical protein
VSRQSIALDNLVSRAESDVAAAAQTLTADRADEARVVGFIDFNIPLHSPAVISRDDLTDVTQWLQQPRRHSGSGVLLDNTTIVTLTSLLAGDRLSPLTLWDLGRAVTALVTYENVFHLANSEVDDNALNAALGQDVFRPLSLPDTGPQYDPTGVRGLFIQAWESTHNIMRQLEACVDTPTVEGLEIEALTSQWSLALGRPLRPADLVNTSRSRIEWRSPGAALLAELWRATRLHNIGIPDPKGLDNLGRMLDLPGAPSGYKDVFYKTIREGNYRGHVNQRLAGHLSLPYMPNVARIPFQSRFYDRAHAISERLPSILALDRRYAERAAQAQLLGGTPFVLPVFLALAVRDAASTQDLWAAVATLRGQARGYRERRADLDRALEQGDLDVTAATLKAVRTEAAKLTTLLADAGRSSAESLTSSVEAKPVALLTGMPLDWLQTGLSALIAGARKLLPESVAHRLMWRLCRPEFRFLSDIASQSRAISTSMPAIQRLWDLPEGRVDAFQHRYESFAGLQDKAGPPPVSRGILESKD